MDNKTEHSASHSLATQVVKVYTAIEASSEAIFVTDLKGRIEYANRQFLDLNGLSEEQAIGLSISKIPNSLKLALNLMQALKDGHSWDRRHQIGSADKNLWVQTCVDPITESPGQVSGFIGVQKTIKDEILKEISTKQRLKNLLTLVVQQEQQLKATQNSPKAILQLDTVKPSFLSSLSHEIRSQLNGVMGMSQILQGTELSEEQSQASSVIHDSANSLLLLINNVLSLSEIERGELELNPRSNNLYLLLEEIQKQYNDKARDKGLALICRYPLDQQEQYIFDQACVLQIIGHLVDNAIKYTEKGHVCIEVIIDESSPNIRIEIRDTGIGILSKNKSTIFDTFTADPLVTSPSTQSVGMGLAISQKLMEMIKGSIGVNSEFGEGSVFWLEFPLEKSQPIEQIPAKLLQNQKVVVINNDQNKTEQTVTMLEQLGIEAAGANSGEDASVLLDQPGYNICLIDSRCTELQEKAWLKKLKQQNILLIQTSACDYNKETFSWTNTQISAALKQPLEKESLYRSLAAALSLPSRQTGAIDIQQAQTGSILRGKNILVVEDNKINQKIIALMLETFKCKVRIVDDGKQAVDLIEQANSSSFDLILMDCQMPVMNGYLATKTIKSMLTEQQKLPIIALTANAQRGDRERCLAAGMDDYLTKPFNKNKLFQTLQKWLIDAIPVVDDVVEKQPAQVKVSNHILDIENKIDSLIEQEEQEEVTPATQENKNDQKVINTDDEISLNPKTLDNIRALQREGAPDILEKIIALYFENSEKLVNEMKQALNDKNIKNISSSAHSLRSCSSNLGADRLANQCETIEDLAAQENFTAIEENYTELVRLYDKACQLLKKVSHETS